MSEVTKDSKFCKDCKWSHMKSFEDKYDWYSSYCTHPKFIPEQKYNHVVGPVSRDYQPCYKLRASGECGPEGKYWESPIKELSAVIAVGANLISTTNHVDAVNETVVNTYPESVSESVKFEDLYWDDVPKPKVSWWNWIRGKAD